MARKNLTFYISEEKLGNFAENSAKMLESSKFSRASNVGAQIAESIRNIRSVVCMWEQFVAEGGRLPKPAEWLTDNWYIAEREGKGAIRDLKLLKGTRSIDGKGKALVMYAAEELVHSGAGEVNAERMSIFLEHFQKVIVLRERELSLFVPALKAALVTELARVALESRALLKPKPKTGSVDGCQSEHELAERAEKIISSLRLMSSIDVSKILERVNRTEQILSEDPAGVYPKMDDKTRIYYRRMISRLSRKTSIEEHKIARALVDLAKGEEGKKSHVGYYIFEKPLGNPRRERTGGLYITAIMLTSLFLALLLGFMLGSPIIAVILLFPISEIVKNITDFLIIKFTRPRHVPKLELKNGVPEEGRTICVISALLTSLKTCPQYASLLEEYRLSNRDSGPNLLFGVLADLPEAREKETGEDGVKLNLLKEKIEALNEKYGGGFFLLTRERVYSEKNGRFMGWERKRGAILELVRLLVGKPSGIRVLAGDERLLENVRYIITLDSDTRLGIGNARELIGAMLHPLNRAEIDIKTGIVAGGHGILQPRVSVSLDAANRTDFTRLFAGQGGIDPYGNTAGDVYQDLFEEGSFTGKGIIDVNAYYSCLEGRFPENLVLSHDLLEGAYLRAGFAGDVEFTDGYPHKVLSFYERLHRWTRGDWQVIFWLFDRVRNEKGERVKNPLNQINRWKIFDNLRRSLVPVFTFTAVYIGMLSTGLNFVTAAVVAVLSTASTLLISSAELVFRRDINAKARYHSTIISGFGAVLTQTLVQLLLLPYEAYVCLHAILTSLYRMLISKKNLLSWVTAADSERRQKESIIWYCRKMFAPMVLGALGIVLSNWIAGVALGAVWFFTPVYAMSLSRERKKKQELSEQDRLFLVRAANDIWRYFSDLCRPSNNFLPPDNFQEQPYIGAAERTSPTNIGLALLSALAAMDLNLTGSEQAPTLIANILTTMEKMPKWNGHLYNWYDTRTLKVLEPAYISTVDSGNLVGALIALREGLLEKGEEFRSLAERAQRLAEAMDFRPLFDEERQLFYIGREADGKPTEGWYDLMASEARLTSYIAIARGEVMKKHWRRLGRVLVSKDNFSGMVSWTGTMFEYLMPNLLLPCYENSMLYESMKFCVYVQKRAHNPWGISESAFFSFDPNLNYRYKAHGVGRLALKRGQDKERVISPYSTFLALQTAPRSAVRNLRRLSRMGMEGRYGYYEAVDFTPMRQLGKKYEIVRCFMAHHLGMSIVAIDNAVNDGIMQKRFMRDREMAAFAELLQEKVPVGQIVLKKPAREVPDKPRVYALQSWQSSGEGVSFEKPACTLISNGSYTVALAETGANRSTWRDLLITRFEDARFGALQGMVFFLRVGNELYSLQPAPDYDKKSSFAYKFTTMSGRIYARNELFNSWVDTKVAPEEYGELRTVCVKNNQCKNLDAELICYFEPVLARRQDYFAHPAFLKLAIETEARDGVIIIKRRSNGRNKSVFAGFACDAPMSFDTMKERALGRGGERNLLNALREPAGNSCGAVLNPCVLARVKLSVKPNEETQVRFSLCIGESAEDVRFSSAEILKLPPLIGAYRAEETAKSLGADAPEIETAMELLRAVVFRRDRSREKAEEFEKATGAKEALWRLGISGDNPIVTALVESEEYVENVKKLLKSHTILRQCGIKCDLVLLTNDGGDYRRPVQSLLMSSLCALGLENDLGSGIFIAGIDNLPELARSSAMVLSCKEKLRPAERWTDELPAELYWKDGVRPFDNLKYYFDSDLSFVVETGGSLPPTAWSSILTNGMFGYIATDCGTGHMWHINARENKVNVWLNDPLTTDGTEQIRVTVGERKYSVFADADGIGCKIRYGFGFAEWEKEIGGVKIKTTAFVPPELDGRILIVKVENGGEAGSLDYFTDLILGADTEQNGLRVTLRENTIVAGNSGNTLFPGERFVTAFSGEILKFSDSDIRSRSVSCISAQVKFKGAAVIVSGFDEDEKIAEYLDIERAEKAFEETKKRWRELVCPLQIKTPERALDCYINGWALYQIISSRILGRTSIYQSGGAYGFRDQLQDVSCIVQHHPRYAREQIIRACEHQYVEGDVQHWWHPTGCNDCNRGVRTLCSDDLLWLPYSLCRYCEVTGDFNFCGEEAEYIESPVLKEGEHERYELPRKSGRFGSVFEHAKKALDFSIERGVGEHGLALIGTGDWNDGFDKIGIGGKGESVWLTWFVAHVCERFAWLCSELGRGELAEEYRRRARQYAEAANRAWDKRWFLRAFFDNGAPVGREGNPECAIDSIAQSFSTWTSYSDREKSLVGLKSAVACLFDRENGIIKLFDPPFTGEGSDPGYIRGYVPGVRENGGQYTHAAVWLALGCLNMGLREEAWDMLRAILPHNHEIDIYKAEPFVLAADVYSNPLHMGRAGWNWYTGAASWYFRVIEEELLGIKLRGGCLKIEPKLPDSWSGFTALWRHGGSELNITVRRGEKPGLIIDNSPVSDVEIDLSKCTGKHDIIIEIS